jgi:hypothetical protein
MKDEKWILENAESVKYNLSENILWVAKMPIRSEKASLFIIFTCKLRNKSVPKVTYYRDTWANSKDFGLQKMWKECNKDGSEIEPRFAYGTMMPVYTTGRK